MAWLEPTSRGDMKAVLLRRWYEQHRESFWERHRPNAERKGSVADNFMLGLINEVRRINSLDDVELSNEYAN